MIIADNAGTSLASPDAVRVIKIGWILLWASLGTALGWQVHSGNFAVNTVAQRDSSRWAVVVIPAVSVSLISSTYLFFFGG